MMKALAHPLRFRILEQLAAGPASPSAIAEALGEPLGNVSYHVKILLQYEAIELVETRPVRGALEHFYKAIAGPHMSWTALELDDTGYEEMAELLARTVDRALEIQAKSARRQAGSDGQPAHRTELAIFHYHRS